MTKSLSELLNVKVRATIYFVAVILLAAGPAFMALTGRMPSEILSPLTLGLGLALLLSGSFWVLTIRKDQRPAPR